MPHFSKPNPSSTFICGCPRTSWTPTIFWEGTSWLTKSATKRSNSVTFARLSPNYALYLFNITWSSRKACLIFFCPIITSYFIFNFLVIGWSNRLLQLSVELASHCHRNGCCWDMNHMLICENTSINKVWCLLSPTFSTWNHNIGRHAKTLLFCLFLLKSLFLK